MNPPEKYVTVKQPDGSRLCGAACCAMAVGKTLEQVLTEAPLSRWPDGQSFMELGDIVRYLARHDVLCGLIPSLFTNGKKLAEQKGKLHGPEKLIPVVYGYRGHPAFITVPSVTRQGTLHYVFWDGVHIRDPSASEPDTAELPSYRVLEVMPLVYLKDVEFPEEKVQK